MCGLVAIFSYGAKAEQVDPSELEKINDHMKSRGPDASGAWLSRDGRVGLGHRRLSLIDLSAAGSQPMTNEDGTLHLVFNGEIYNYRPLRARLIAAGHVFKSRTDSEVLLHLYEEMGERMMSELRGMFAFALWDSKREAMMLARDPYGIKPLYYADDGATLRAASQVKAIVAGGCVGRAIDPAGVAGFYLTGSVPEPFTIYREIRSVPAGSLVRIDHLGPSPARRYFCVAETLREAEKRRAPVSQTEAAQVAREALLDSVRHHLIADVPVIAFLSGGIDSGALVGLARDAGAEDLRTVTLAFAEYRGGRDDEAPLACEVARLYGTRHTTRVLGEAEFSAELPKFLSAMDQPTIDGINSYFISKAAAELGVKAALSGLGGDELFGGYPSFRDIPRWVKSSRAASLVPGLGRLTRLVASRLLPRGASPKLAGAVEYGGTYAGAYLLRRGLFMPWELASLIGEEMAVEGLNRLALIPLISAAIDPYPGTSYSRVAALEASLYMRNQLLRDADWASMAHSLEVRVPLVDAQLLKRVAPALISQPRLEGKRLLAESPSTALPPSVSKRPKTGFTVPINRWLERNGGLDAWRAIPALARPGIHWARRWAYTAASLALAH
jgi:asparagine synthase (glutamine-hydrolysing)